MTKLPNPGRRSTEEWIGETPDQKVPAYVQVRVFERHGGICHISGRKIQTGEAWELDHDVPLWKGGEHRESNFRPALVKPHRGKTAEEAKERAAGNRKRKKHLGIPRQPKRLIPGSKGSGWRQRLTSHGPKAEKEQ